MDIEELHGEFIGVKTIVNNVKENITTLKARCTKISNELSQIKAQGQQEQIFALADRVSQIENSLLETDRFVAGLAIQQLRLHLERTLSQDRENPRIIRQNAREYVIERCATAAQLISDSSTPFQVYNDYLTQCGTYFRDKGLPGFRES